MTRMSLTFQILAHEEEDPLGRYGNGELAASDCMTSHDAQSYQRVEIHLSQTFTDTKKTIFKLYRAFRAFVHSRNGCYSNQPPMSILRDGTNSILPMSQGPSRDPRSPPFQTSIILIAEGIQLRTLKTFSNSIFLHHLNGNPPPSASVKSSQNPSKLKLTSTSTSNNPSNPVWGGVKPECASPDAIKPGPSVLAPARERNDGFARRSCHDSSLG